MAGLWVLVALLALVAPLVLMALLAPESGAYFNLNGKRPANGMNGNGNAKRAERNKRNCAAVIRARRSF